MWFKKAYKLFLFISVITIYLVWSLLNRVRSRDLMKRRRYYTHTVSVVSRLALWLMKFKINYINPPTSNQHYLFVGNHLGMLDVLIIAAKFPTLFITSVEMKNTPGLGLLSEAGGCLYTERRDRSNIQNEMLEIREALRQGLNVTLYPEGTSTNGEGLLPLKKTLMTAAAGTGVPIKPMVLNYRKVNGHPMSGEWRDYLCWYGDLTFIDSLFNIFSLDRIDADLEFLEDVVVHNEEERREVAKRIQDAMIAKYDPILLLPSEKSPYPEGLILKKESN